MITYALKAFKPWVPRGLEVGKELQSPSAKTFGYFWCWHVSLSTSTKPTAFAKGLLLTDSFWARKRQTGEIEAPHDVWGAHWRRDVQEIEAFRHDFAASRAKTAPTKRPEPSFSKTAICMSPSTSTRLVFTLGETPENP